MSRNSSRRGFLKKLPVTAVTFAAESELFRHFRALLRPCFLKRRAILQWGNYSCGRFTRK
jgi:hypothetical protein